MFTRYTTEALRHAHYEMLPEDQCFYGEIAHCPGVYATGKTLEDCRQELVEVLEEWVLFRVHQHLTLPVINGISLTFEEVA